MKEGDILREALDKLRSQYAPMSDRPKGSKGIGLNLTPYKSGSTGNSPYEGTAATVAGSNFLRDHEIKKLKDSMGNLEEQMTHIRKQLEEAKSDIQENKRAVLGEFEDKVDRQTAKLESQIRRDRFKNIEIISIVAAFFAFIAAEFQLFAHLKNFWQFLAITLIVFGCTSFFAIIMGWAADTSTADTTRSSRHRGLMAFSIIMIVAGTTVSIASYSFEKGVIESRDNYIKIKHQACGDLTDHIGSFDFSVQDSAQKYEQLRKKYDNLQCGSPDLLK